RAKLPYALGVSSDLKIFVGTPALTAPPPLVGKGRPRTRPQLPPGTQTIEARAWAATQPSRRWRLVSWRNGTNPPWRARFCATRVTPAHDWRERRLAPEVWLLCERDLGPEPRTKYYLVNLPATASLRALVRLAHQRWAIEQQYQELKDEIGLDHFEGRTLPGWQRHVVLTAIAYSFLQNERRRRGQTQLTLPQVRAVIQEVLTAHFFMTQPHYLKWMLKLKDVELRI
ncbi:MAG: transposase, partial [Vicinamibacteraceae bacterium]